MTGCLKKSVVVVDDHEIVRAGIVSLLKTLPNVQVVAEAERGEEAVQIVSKLSPDVVLMDIRMPGIGGLQATINILRSSPATKVVALTVCNDDLFPTKLLQAGAHGYLTKNTNKEEVRLAVDTVVAGRRYISPDIASNMALKHLNAQGNPPFELLSDRELQVAMMITSGRKVQEISEVLFLSPKTVNSYRYRIFDKLTVKNDVELTRLAYKHGLLEGIDAEAVGGLGDE